MDLWGREAMGNGVVSDEWEAATTELGQTVVSLTIAMSSDLSEEARNLEFYMEYPNF